MDTATTPPKFITSADVEKAITDRLRLIVIGIEDNEDYISDDPEIRVEFMRAIGIPEHLLPSYEVEKAYKAYVTVTYCTEVFVDSVHHDNDAELYEVESIVSEMLNLSPDDFIDVPHGVTIEEITIDDIQEQ